ncbi:hypothetical protein ACTXT7_017511 [Hymenolepis weldensis]
MGPMRIWDSLKRRKTELTSQCDPSDGVSIYMDRVAHVARMTEMEIGKSGSTSHSTNVQVSGFRVDHSSLFFLFAGWRPYS